MLTFLSSFPLLSSSCTAISHRAVTTRACTSPASLRPVDVAAEKIKAEIPTLFTTSKPDFSLYAENVEFEDPLTKFSGVSRYESNIAFLRDSFVFSDTKLVLYDIKIIEEDLVRTRWMLSMKAALPWQPRASFTGQSDYVVNKEGLVVRHIDYWDSISSSAYFSWEGFKDFIGQCAPAKGYQGDYELLRRTEECEIRRWKNGVCLEENNGEWREAKVGQTLQLAAARKIGADGVAAAERIVRYALKEVTYAKVSKSAFVVSVGNGNREIWVQLETANADVNVETLYAH